MPMSYTTSWDLTDVNLSPVRFGPLLIRFGESNARVSNLPNHRGLAEVLNPHATV